MDANILSDNTNCIIGKYNSDINYRQKRETICYDLIRSQQFYPCGYAQIKIRWSMIDYEYYKSASGPAGRNYTRVLWRLFCIWKIIQNIVRPTYNRITHYILPQNKDNLPLTFLATMKHFFFWIIFINDCICILTVWNG